MNKIDLNSEFKKAIDLMENSSENLFITGKAGTGKSTLLDYFRSKSKKSVIVLAPTGVAALNVKGETIHSFFRFKPEVTIEDAKKSGHIVDEELFKKIDAIVIDEISMVRADLMDHIDTVLKIVLKNKKPFGGMQMIMIGDLYQLPPVVKGEDRKFFQTHYKSPYFFDCNAFTHTKFKLKIIELEKIYRQKDPAFIELLNAIRNKDITENHIKALNKRFDDDFKKDDGYIYLTTINKTADEINHKKLISLHGKVHQFTAKVKGEFAANQFPTDLELKLKKKAQIMFLNNDAAGRWVNGSIGKVIGFGTTDEGQPCVVVELEEDKNIVEVTEHKWQVYRSIYDKKAKVLEKESIGSFSQIPLRLSWALTIHKSQGKTFDKVIIDFGRGTFTHGQSYVALSRCRTFEGMVLKKMLKKNHVIMDWRVSKFLTDYQYEKSARKCSTKDKVSMIKKIIKKKSKMKIVYLKTKNIKSKRILQPSFVGELEYAGKTYLGMEAFCLLRKAERVFRVDRILEIEEIT